MRHFAHHIGDYAAATAHLSMIEDGAYHRLLRRYYQDERPLPADLADVQRLAGARTREEKRAVEAVLREFFTLTEEGWRQGRCDDEIATYQEKVSTARENGATGGRPKRKRVSRKAKDLENQGGSQTQTQGEPTEKLTTNHSPLTNNQEEKIAFARFLEAAARHDWPKPQALDAGRLAKIKARLAEHGIDGWSAALAKAEDSEFICKDMAGWSLDWLLKPANFTKVLEGNYTNRLNGGAHKNGASTATTSTAEQPWAQRLKGYRIGDRWPGAFGPRPESGQCYAPKPILEAWREAQPKAEQAA